MKKLGKKDRMRIQLRWLKKYNEFIKLDKEELKKLYNETKMSSTDKHALTQAVQEILYKESQLVSDESQKVNEELDKIESDGNVDIKEETNEEGKQV